MPISEGQHLATLDGSQTQSDTRRSNAMKRSPPARNAIEEVEIALGVEAKRNGPEPPAEPTRQRAKNVAIKRSASHSSGFRIVLLTPPLLAEMYQ